ncbi:MAG: hypothetical protein QOF01_2229 [Thermomicrobiales bacterium]|nr:hypothetical protein [Thermomicrobiales bacterium]
MGPTWEHSIPIVWLTNWDTALAEARATRRVVLIDVWKDP